jgi:plasmid maintenance system antidote protein VapI
MTTSGMLREVLRQMGWTQKDLAIVLGRPVQMVCEIANSKKRVTATTARELEAATGRPARAWLKCDLEDELRAAKLPPARVRAIKARRRARLR